MQQPDLFSVPVSGRSQRARHASLSGARSQTKRIWTAKQEALLEMLKGGPKSRAELAELLHWPISSVCSILDSVLPYLESVDFETVEWSAGRQTRRERFGVKR